MKKPIVGITMGDPAGIGPEIVVKALLKPEVYNVCRPVIIGDLGLLKYVAGQFQEVVFKTIESPLKILHRSSVIYVIDLQNVDLGCLKIGETSIASGKASLEYIEVAVKYATEGELDAIVTAPINKKSIHLAGSNHIGHTEIFGALTNTKDPVTMFLVHGVRIFFLTRHLSLKEAIDAVKKDKIEAAIIRINNFLQKMGLEKPRIAIPALNPHASDHGLLGEEEAKEIIPAVKDLRKRGVGIEGPIPADIVFNQAFSGKYDAVLTLYHDQGHIPAKTIDFYGTVSVTLDLPFIRTSVDHGTAFEIAGKGVANSRSLEEAIKVAAKMVELMAKGTRTYGDIT